MNGVTLRTAATILALAIWGGVFAAPATAQDADPLRALEDAFVGIIERSESSVVSIARYRLPQRGLEDWRELPRDDEDNPFTPNDFGSGILFTHPKAQSRPLVLTNYHVVRGDWKNDKSAAADATGLEVRFASRERCTARILAADPRCDLAVLELSLDTAHIDPASLKPFEIRPAHDLKKGQIVLTLGNPYALARDGSASAGWGIISNVMRRPAEPEGDRTDPEHELKRTIHHFGTLLQVDARLNLGYSGGALLNRKGELIGLITSLAALDGYEKSVGYAIPIDDATVRAVDALVQGFEVEYGFLGISPRTFDVDQLRTVPRSFAPPTAVVVYRVIGNSPAALAGLKQEDVILQVDDAPVSNSLELMREIAEAGPDANVRLRIWRTQEGRELTRTAKLGKWPVYDDEGIIVTHHRYPEWRGLRIDYSTSRQKYVPYPPYSYDRGVVVTEVSSQGTAARAGVKPGEVITGLDGRAVTTPAEFHRLAESLKGRTVELQFNNDRRVELAP